MSRVCVSSCRCCVFVSVVHPVAILSAVFCVICSLLMFVSNASGDHNITFFFLRETRDCLFSGGETPLMPLLVALLAVFPFLFQPLVYSW